MEKRIHYSMESSNSSIDLIPLDLWLQILAFFPVKTLLVLRAVCKSFLSIIDDPYVVRRFPLNSQENRFLVHHGSSNGIIFEVYEPYKTIRIIDSVEKPGSPTMNPPVGCWNLVCSLNGLLLLSTTSRYPNRIDTSAALWNPSIKKHRQLSLPSPEARNLGLGYDPLSNDYKVVALHASRDQAWGYSVKTKSWTDILDRRFCEGELYSDSDSKCFPCKNGVVWIERIPKRHRSRLVWFEFGGERFRCVDEIPSPAHQRAHHELVMLDGGSTIGVWWANEKEERVFVWALETDNTSWTLCYTLALPDELLGYDLCSVGHTYRSRLDEKNGELVWKYWVNQKWFKVVTYNMDVETQVYCKRDFETVRNCLDIYVESLVMAN